MTTKQRFHVTDPDINGNFYIVDIMTGFDICQHQSRESLYFICDILNNSDEGQVDLSDTRDYNDETEF